MDDTDLFDPSTLTSVLQECRDNAQCPYAFLAPLVFGLDEWRRLSGNQQVKYGDDPLTEYFLHEG